MTNRLVEGLTSIKETSCILKLNRHVHVYSSLNPKLYIVHACSLGMRPRSALKLYDHISCTTPHIPAVNAQGSICVVGFVCVPSTLALLRQYLIYPWAVLKFSELRTVCIYHLVSYLVTQCIQSRANQSILSVFPSVNLSKMYEKSTSKSLNWLRHLETSY